MSKQPGQMTKAELEAEVRRLTAMFDIGTITDGQARRLHEARDILARMGRAARGW